MYMGFDPFNLLVGGSGNQEVWAMDGCDSFDYDITFYYSTWWTGNTQVATANMSLIHGVAAGSTSNLANGQVPKPAPQGEYCPTRSNTPSGGDCVLQFQIIGNPFVFVGTNSNIVAANSFYATNGSGGNPQPSGGTVSATSSDSNDTLQATQGNPPVVKVTTTDQSTTNLDRTLTFTYTVTGCGSMSRSMSVTARQFAYLNNNNPSNTCTLGYGTDQTYIYTVYTHPDRTAVEANSGLSGTPVTESFNPSVQCGAVTSPGALDANGLLADHIASGCSTSPLTCTWSTTQAIKVAGYQVRTNTLNFTSSGVVYTNNGPNQ
jgi:hypothetical protein